MQAKKILVVTIPEKGHINPMIGIAQHLQAMGYELAFFAQVDISAQLQRAGLQGKVYHDPSPVNIDATFITKGADFVRQLADTEWLRQWIKTLLVDAVPSQMQLLDKVVKDFEPALIVTDPMIYASALVAHAHKIPWVGVSSSLNPITPNDWQCELTDTLDALSAQRDQLFASKGLTPRFKVSDAISPWLNIVFATETYMPRVLCENDFSFYAGHSFPAEVRGDETDFPFHRLHPGTRKVYMSMGSQIYYHPQLFTAVSKALYDADIQLIFAINELLDTPFAASLPDNVIAVSYAPQLQLLPLVDLVISHGGANSVMETLAHGLPLALLPICNDQFLQAKFVTRAGTGIVLDPAHPSPEKYREQLLPLLDQASPIRVNAKSIGEAYRAKEGAAGAAKKISELFVTQQSMLPIS